MGDEYQLAARCNSHEAAVAMLDHISDEYDTCTIGDKARKSPWLLEARIEEDKFYPPHIWALEEVKNKK